MSTLLERCIHVLIMNFMFVNQCDYLNDNHYCLEKLPIMILYIHIYIVFTRVLICICSGMYHPQELRILINCPLTLDEMSLDTSIGCFFSFYYRSSSLPENSSGDIRTFT